MPLCSLFEDEDHDICIKCKENNFLVENSEGNRICVNESLIEEYYLYINTEDLKVYKKCEIENCNKCIYAPELESKVKCDSCISPYKIIDNGLFCGNISTMLYYEDSPDMYKSCIKYSSFNNCYKCKKTELFTCLECRSNYIIL